MIQGSRVEAEEGSLVCLAAGNKSLYDECESAFRAISKTSVYLGKPEKHIIIVLDICIQCIYILSGYTT